MIDYRHQVVLYLEKIELDVLLRYRACLVHVEKPEDFLEVRFVAEFQLGGFSVDDLLNVLSLTLLPIDFLTKVAQFDVCAVVVIIEVAQSMEELILSHAVIAFCLV